MREAFIIALLLFPLTGYAAEYRVNLGSITDYERIRSLIDRCSDLGELEGMRRLIDRTSDLEELRSTFEEVGHAYFKGCPSGIEVPGVRSAD